MGSSISEARQAALRIGKQLTSKSREAEAVAVLTAWAAAGPNDAEGQMLLAAALQLQPSSTLAKMAFARMEGLGGAQPELDEAIRLYDEARLAALEKELLRPAFRRAQLGFNNDLKYKGAAYHAQTEDSGLDKPHVITHLFADGGRVIKSYKRSYAGEVERPDVASFVRALMKGQHMEMALALRGGRFDAIIEGREKGGMEVLEHPPAVDLQRVGHAPKSVPPARHRQPTKPEGELRHEAPVRFVLHVQRSLTGGPERYEPTDDVVLIGSAGPVSLPGERFCHPREAVLRWIDGQLVLEDLDGGNGVFFRVRQPVELDIGDEFVIGDQLLRIDRVPEFDHTPGPGPTYCYSSPVWTSPFRVVQIFEGGAEGACTLARRTTLYVGSGYNDMIIRNDPLVSEHHCFLDEQAGTIVLYDLDSRTGVFVRVHGQQPLKHGDEVLIGRTRLLVDLSPSVPGARPLA
jgi:pSer/pThr/pTyr-binding forkhead associated (FHA) protein